MTQNLIGSSVATSNIVRSLRFNSNDSSFLGRTPSVSSNRRTFTISTWVKRSVLGTDQIIFSAGTTVNRFWLMFDTNGALRLDSNNIIRRVSTPLFRDTGAWYHVVCAIDTTNSTASLRQLMYVNGRQITTFSTVNDFALNTDTDVNSTVAHAIGRNTELNDRYFNGYISDFYFIDGLALTPQNFAFFDANRVWQPKQYLGPFGYNGFYLDFSDNSDTTPTTLGRDRSGNNNNWTPNNFSVASGVNNDSLLDTPTVNYCVLNTNDVGSGANVINGSLDLSAPSSWNLCRATFRLPDTGLWYWEQTTSGAASSSNGLSAGIANGLVSNAATTPATAGLWILSSSGSNAAIYSNGTALITTLPNYSIGEVLRVAWNANTKKLWLGRSGGWYNSAFNLTGDPTDDNTATIDLISIPGPFFPVVQSFSLTQSLNFGQRPFNYTVPSGYQQLNSANLIQEFVRNPAFQAQLYTGNGGTQFVPLNFTPSMIWTKRRAAAELTMLSDQLRDAGDILYLGSTSAQAAPGEQNSSINGFSVRQLTQNRNVNTATYVGYGWARAPQYGLDIVRYIGNNTANRTIQHRLGSTPEFIIVKRIDATGEWYVWHKNMTSDAHFTTFGSVAESNTNSPWGSGIKNSSIFTVTNNATNNLNILNAVYIAYVFSSVPGHSDFGAYVGNANANGSFCNMNFTPAAFIVKNRNAAQPWTIMDTARGGAFNPVGISNNLGAAAAEVNTTTTDILSNGVKWRIATDPVNASATYLYCAWSERAFKYVRAR